MTQAVTEAKTETTAALEHTNEAQPMLDDLLIRTDQDSEFAAGLLRDVKARHKQLEGKRKAITTPLLAAKREVDALFRPVREALEFAEKTLKNKITAYVESLEEKNAAAIVMAAKADTPEVAVRALAAVVEAAPPAGVSVRYVQIPEIANVDAIPRAFLVPDMAKIKAHGPDIAGVVFVKTPVVSSRG